MTYNVCNFFAIHTYNTNQFLPCSKLWMHTCTDTPPIYNWQHYFISFKMLSSCLAITKRSTKHDMNINDQGQQIANTYIHANPVTCGYKCLHIHRVEFYTLQLTQRFTLIPLDVLAAQEIYSTMRYILTYTHISNASYLLKPWENQLSGIQIAMPVSCTQPMASSSSNCPAKLSVEWK